MPDTTPVMSPEALCEFYLNLSDAIYVIDPVSSKILDANKSACEDLGMTRGELLNQSVLSLNVDVVGEAQWSEIAGVIRQAGSFLFVGRHKRKDGSDFPVEVRTDHICFEGKEFFVSVARDVTPRSLQHDELKSNDFIRAFALNEASDGLWDWDIVNGTLFLSPQWYRMMGYGPHEITDPTLELWKSAIHPDDADRVMGLIDLHLKGKSSRFEAKYRLKNRNGHYIWVHDRGFVVQRDNQNNPARMIGLVLDITQSQVLAERLVKHSQEDDLTGLYNRRTGYELFEQHLKICQHEGAELQVAMLDLDHFKLINDNYGHLNGDKAIKHFAHCVRQMIRKSDMLFRWGGEEFLLLCPDMSQQSMCNFVTRILENLTLHPFVTDDGIQLHISASAGVSSYPEHGSTITDLVRIADAAMYEAKVQGRNRLYLGTRAKHQT